MRRESLEFGKSWTSALPLVALILSIVGHGEGGSDGGRTNVFDEKKVSMAFGREPTVGYLHSYELFTSRNASIGLGDYLATNFMAVVAP
jgi:hypothetical protein